MKQLQNNFTTPEQSKRLLELGVPAESADCYLLKNRITKQYEYIQVINNQDDLNFLDEDSIPCWSVGRLMEIAHICSDSALSYREEANEIQKFKEEHKCETLIEAVILCVEDAVSVGSIDLSKLEE